VKRSPALTAALSLAAVLLPFSPGSARSATVSRGFTEEVTATTTPMRDRVRPYTFTTRGRIVTPPTFVFCAPGFDATPGAGNCLPLLCPPGATNLDYCQVPGRSVICSGRLTVRFQKRNTTISSRKVNVRPDCTYRSRVTFRSPLTARRGVLRVRVRFQGNRVLRPKSSTTQTVRAG